MSDNVAQTIKNNQIVVFQIPKGDYGAKSLGVVSAVSKLHKEACYVTLNKPFQTIAKEMEEKKIDTKGFVFIDGSSSSSKAAGYRVVFIQSPKAITELSIEMSGLMGKKTESFVFDSLSTLLIYEDSMTAIKFVHSMVSKIRTTGKKCVFLALKEDKDTDMMKDVNMFVDKVVSL